MAVKAAPKPAPHLRDLFLRGKEVTLTHPDAGGLVVWVQKPSSIQQEKAARAARAKRARRRAELLDAKTDERLSLVLEVDSLTLDEIADQFMALKRADLHRQAVNEIMFSPDYGSDWGKEGEKYIDLVDALIEKGKELSESQDGATQSFDEDPEWVRLNGLQNVFEREVTERAQELMDTAKEELIATKAVEDIRADYLKRHIDTEGELAWYIEYKTQMIYYATRYVDDHDRLYFASATEVLDMPVPVQSQLMDEYEALVQDAGDLKNSLTPQGS